MADFDSFDYDIESRLPEWWKGFGALEPVNQYTQKLIAEILEGLLTTLGVAPDAIIVLFVVAPKPTLCALE